MISEKGRDLIDGLAAMVQLSVEVAMTIPIGGRSGVENNFIAQFVGKIEETPQVSDVVVGIQAGMNVAQPKEIEVEFLLLH